MGEYDEYYKARTYHEATNWLLIKSPLPIIGLVAAYLVFVLKVGPDFMSKRKPYSLQVVLIVYNFFLALHSLCIVLAFFAFGAIRFWYNNGFCRVDISDDVVPIASHVAWWYILAKIIELADTVFFVLRKKQQQVTFLHVYHHTIMILVCWILTKYFPCEQATFNLLMNSIIHVFMYVYYMLAAMGPSYQKYLWWKKYLTVLQLVQFSVLILYSSSLLLLDCKHPKGVSLFFLIFHVLFWYLFANFYYNAYIKKKVKV